MHRLLNSTPALKFHRWFIFVWFFVVLSGCVSIIHPVQEQKEWTEARGAKDTSIVFGRIQLIENGEEKKIGWGDGNIAEWFLMNLKDKSRTATLVTQNGGFIWPLKKGVYRIFKIQYTALFGGFILFTGVTINVPENEKIYYVGTLKAEFTWKQGLKGLIEAPRQAELKIVDESDQAYGIIRDKFNVSLGDIEKSMLIHEEQRLTTVDKNTFGAQSMEEPLAVESLRYYAAKGYAKAQYNLGVCYYEGTCVDRDEAEAVKWWLEAANRGYINAEYNLGIAYLSSRGVAKDDVEAVKWLRQAADRGLANAQYSLGLLYAMGEGVPKDVAEAMRWIHSAADQGYAEAQYSLGLAYLQGVAGVITKNEAEAVKWFQRAADQGNLSAREALRRPGRAYRPPTELPKP